MSRMDLMEMGGTGRLVDDSWNEARLSSSKTEFNLVSDLFLQRVVQPTDDDGT